MKTCFTGTSNTAFPEGILFFFLKFSLLILKHYHVSHPLAPNIVLREQNQCSAQATISRVTTYSPLSLFSAPLQSASHINLLIISPHSYCVFFLFLPCSSSSSSFIMSYQINHNTFLLTMSSPTSFHSHYRLVRVNVLMQKQDGITSLRQGPIVSVRVCDCRLRKQFQFSSNENGI